MIAIRAAGLVVLAIAAAAGLPAWAQQQPPGWTTQPPPASGQSAPKPAAKAAPKPAAPQPKAASTAAEPDTSGGTRSEAQLRQRVEQLEEQLVDLQVVIGTLESLAKSAGTSASSVAFRAGGGGTVSASDGGRIDGIETQIRALTAQVEQLAEQVRSGGSRASGAYGATAVASAPPPARPAAPAAFGTTVVTAGGDQAGRGTGDEAQQPAVQRQAAAPAADPAGAKQLYETAYGYLLQQNYGAAEASFGDFLQRYPQDALAGNAQYWLGESHYVRGDYKAAASAFLKGYQGYSKSAKAPDSLLKLAMSLDRLGQKDAACSSYGELGVRFPQAPAHVKARADSERRRLGCA